MLLVKKQVCAECCMALGRLGFTTALQGSSDPPGRAERDVSGEGTSLGTRVQSCLSDMRFSSCQVQATVLGSKLEMVAVFLLDSGQ